MIIKRYRITVVEETLKSHLLSKGDRYYWFIAARNMKSAWSKFATQHFGVLKPNPSDYDISLERY